MPRRDQTWTSVKVPGRHSVHESCSTVVCHPGQQRPSACSAARSTRRPSAARSGQLSPGVGAPLQPRRPSSSALLVSAGVNRDGCSPSAPRARSIPHGRHNLERVSKETRVGDVTAAVVHAVQCAPLLGLLPCGRYGMCLMGRECSGVASPTGDSYTIYSRRPLARSQPPLAIGGEVVLSARLGGRVSLFEGTSSPSGLNPTPLCLGGDATRVPGHGLLEPMLICPLCLMLTFSQLSGFLELAVPQPSQAGACKLAHIRSSVRLWGSHCGRIPAIAMIAVHGISRGVWLRMLQVCFKSPCGNSNSDAYRASHGVTVCLKILEWAAFNIWGYWLLRLLARSSAAHSSLQTWG